MDGSGAVQLRVVVPAFSSWTAVRPVGSGQRSGGRHGNAIPTGSVTVAGVAYGPEPVVYVGVAGLHGGVAIGSVRGAGEKFSAGYVLRRRWGGKAAAVESIVAHVGSGVWSRPAEDDCGCGYVVPDGQPAGRLWDTLSDCGGRDGSEGGKVTPRVGVLGLHSVSVGSSWSNAEVPVRGVGAVGGDHLPAAGLATGD